MRVELTREAPRSTLLHDLTEAHHGGGPDSDGGLPSMRAVSDDGKAVVDVELPYHSKHLLLAAFLAAHSPPSRDVASFSLQHAGPMRRKKGGGLCTRPRAPPRESL